MKALDVSFSNALSSITMWVTFSFLNSFKWCQISAIKMKQHRKAHRSVYIWNDSCIFTSPREQETQQGSKCWRGCSWAHIPLNNLLTACSHKVKRLCQLLLKTQDFRPKIYGHFRLVAPYHHLYSFTYSSTLDKSLAYISCFPFSENGNWHLISNLTTFFWGLLIFLKLITLRTGMEHLNI